MFFLRYIGMGTFIDIFKDLAQSKKSRFKSLFIVSWVSIPQAQIKRERRQI